MEFAYPKLKYKAADGFPGYTHVQVADPDEEAALGEGYFDTPGEMRGDPEPATAAEASAPDSGDAVADPEPAPKAPKTSKKKS